MIHRRSLLCGWEAIFSHSVCTKLAFQFLLSLNCQGNISLSTKGRGQVYNLHTCCSKKGEQFGTVPGFTKISMLMHAMDAGRMWYTAISITPLIPLQLQMWPRGRWNDEGNKTPPQQQHGFYGKPQTERLKQDCWTTTMLISVVFAEASQHWRSTVESSEVLLVDACFNGHSDPTNFTQYISTWFIIWHICRKCPSR